ALDRARDHGLACGLGRGGRGRRGGGGRRAGGRRRRGGRLGGARRQRGRAVGLDREVQGAHAEAAAGRGGRYRDRGAAGLGGRQPRDDLTGVGGERAAGARPVVLKNAVVRVVSHHLEGDRLAGGDQVVGVGREALDHGVPRAGAVSDGGTGGGADGGLPVR